MSGDDFDLFIHDPDECEWCEFHQQVADLAKLPEVRDSFSTWRVTWIRCMSMLGYPHAMLDYDLSDNDGTVSYRWEPDTDKYLHAYRFNEDYDSDNQAWKSAHAAFLFVDALRPLWVAPSLALQEFIEQRNRMN